MKNKLLFRVITTLLGWAVAFVIAYIMLLLFGEELRKMPSFVTALLFSGVLVTVMGNFVMPWLNKVISRYIKDKNQ